MAERSLDPRVSVWDLGPTAAHPWWVVCPRCDGRAARIQDRVVCGACGYDRVSAWRTERLWLRTPCCGQVLFAVNERHLALLEEHLTAKLRERTRVAGLGWSNQSVASRLPRWMKAGRNRDEVARGLRRLRARLAER